MYTSREFEDDPQWLEPAAHEWESEDEERLPKSPFKTGEAFLSARSGWTWPLSAPSRPGLVAGISGTPPSPHADGLAAPGVSGVPAEANRVPRLA